MKRLIILTILTCLAPAFLGAQSFRVPSEQSLSQSGGQSREVVGATDEYFIYIAKWYDDLERIGKMFGIDKDVLKAYNGMDSYKTTRRQKVRIPRHPEQIVIPVDDLASNKISEEEADSLAAKATEWMTTGPEDDERPDYSLSSLFTRKSGEPGRIKVDVILPLNASGKPNASSFELYSGILLAVRDLSQTGIQADLTVIDKGAGPITRELLGEPDLILGPVSSSDLEEVLSVCDSTTAVVSLLDHKADSLAAGHPNFIQASSPVNTQYQELVGWLREDYIPGDKVLLVCEKGADSTVVANLLHEAGLDYSIVQYGILQTKSAEAEITRRMTTSGTNRAILASDKEAFVNDAVRNLSLMTYKDMEVVMYAPSKIRNFETIDIESLHNVNTHLCCAYFVDYDSPRVKSFLPAYRALYGAEPTPYAYQGYDAAWYFIQAYFAPSLTRGTGLQSDFDIPDANDGNGHINTATRRVVYGPDYSVSTVVR